MRFLRVVDPFTEGIEQEIRCEAAGEYHGAPFPELEFRLCILSAQTDLADPGIRDPDGYDQNTETDDQIVGSKGVSEKSADLIDNFR
jgi:hypothetical protein